MENIISIVPEIPIERMNLKQLNERLNFLLVERDKAVICLKSYTAEYNESMLVKTEDVLEINDNLVSDTLFITQNFISKPRPNAKAIELINKILVVTKRLKGIEIQLNKLSELLIIN